MSTPFKDANEMNEFGEKKKLKSLSAPVGDAINQADIDSRTKANLDKMNRAKSQYEEAQKRLDGLKEMNKGLEKINVEKQQLNPNYTGPGISTSGTSIDMPYFKGNAPEPVYKDPKLDPIPKAEYAKMQMSWHSPSSGSAKQPKDFISLTLKSTTAKPKSGAKWQDLMNDIDKVKIEDGDGLSGVFTTQLANAFNPYVALNKRNFQAKDTNGQPFKGKTNLDLGEAFVYKVWQINDFVQNLPKRTVGTDPTTGQTVTVPDTSGLNGDQQRLYKWYKDYMDTDNVNGSVLTLASRSSSTGAQTYSIVPGAAASGRYATKDYTASSWVTNTLSLKSGRKGDSADDYEVKYRLNAAGKKAGEAFTELADILAKDNNDFQDIVTTTGLNGDPVTVDRSQRENWNVAKDAMGSWLFGTLLPEFDPEQKNVLLRAASDSSKLNNRLVKPGIDYNATSSDEYFAQDHPMLEYVDFDPASRARRPKYAPRIWTPMGTKKEVINPIWSNKIKITYP